MSAATGTWIGPSGGFWHNVNNWQNLALPTALDDELLGSFDTLINSTTAVGSVSGTGTLRLVSFGSSGLSLNGNSAPGGLSLDGGTFSSSANTVISGELLWRQGNISGSGLTRVSGVATLDLDGGGGVLSGGQTLLLQGRIQARIDEFSNFNALGIGSNARLVSSGSRLDQTRADTRFTNPVVGSLGHFDNQGSFTKATDTTTTFERGVQALEALSNTSTLAPGSIGQRGQLNLLGALDQSGHLLLEISSGLVLSNTGTIKVNGGTLRISQAFNNQGQLNVAAGAELVSSVVDFANAGTLAAGGLIARAR